MSPDKYQTAALKTAALERGLNQQGRTLSQKGIGKTMNIYTGGEWGVGTSKRPVPPPNEKDADLYDQPAYGLGEWDYQIANSSDRRGPDGQELPKGAEAWDAWGRPYYGEGLGGWWKEVSSRFTAPIEEAPTLKEDVKFEFTPFWEIPKAAEESGQPVWAEALANASQNIGAVSKFIENLGMNLRNLSGEAGDKPTAIAYVGRAAEEAIHSTFKGFDALGKTGKRVVGWGLFTLNDLAAQSNLPEFKLIPEGTNIPDILPFEDEKYIELINKSNPLSWAWNSLRSVDALITGDVDLKGISKDNWQAARIAGTAFFEDAVRQEYIRRIHAGENPALLASELEEPLKEIGPEIALDPTNFISFATKALKLAGRVAKATKLYSVPDDVKDIVGAIRAAVRLDEGRGLQALQDLRNYLVKLSTDVDFRVAKHVDKLWRFGRTAGGERAYFLNRINPLIAGIARMGKNPDDVGNIFKFLMKMASGDLEMTSEGMAILRHVAAPELLLSPAAHELGMVLNRLTDGAEKVPKWFNEYNKLTEMPERVAFLEKKLEGVLDDVIPTLSQKIKAVEKAKEAGEDVEDIHWFLKTIDGTHKKAQKVMGPVNSLIANTLLRYNPGFTWRNMLSDFSTTFVDEGLEAAFYRASKALDDVEGIMGHVPAGARKTFGGPAAALSERIEKATGLKLGLADFIKGTSSDKVEQISGIKIYAKSLKDALRRTIPASMPATDGMKAAGVGDGTINFIQAMLRDNYGNVDKVKEFLGRTGILERARTLDMLNPHDLKVLDNLVMGHGARDEMVRIANEVIDNNGSLDDVLVEWEGLFNQVREKAAIADTLPIVDDFEEGGHAEAILENALDAKDITPEAQKLSAYQRVANQQATSLWRRTSNELLDHAERVANQTGNEEFLAAINQLRDEYYPLLKGTIDAEAQRVSDDIIREARRWSYAPPGSGKSNRAIREEYVKTFGLDGMWRKMGLPGEPPTNLTMQSLYDVYWDEYIIPRLSDHWALDLETHTQSGENLLNKFTQISEQFGYTPQSNLLEKAREATDHARQLPNALVLSDGRVYFAKGPRALETKRIMQLALKYGIPGATSKDPSEFIFNNRLLNTLKKYTGQEFNSLDDISFADAKKALEMWATEKGKDIIPVLYADQYGELTKVSINIDKTKKQEDLRDAIDRLPEAFREKALANLEKRAETATEGAGEATKVASTDFTPAKTILVDNGLAPSPAQATYANMEDYEKVFSRVVDDYSAAWGQMELAPTGSGQRKAINTWLDQAGRRAEEAKVISDAVATAARDFALHDYRDRRVLDLVMAYLMPFWFWPSRTYPKWLQRIVQNPGAIAAYGHYRDMMEKIHAGAPEWWKYQISTNELLGLDAENPLYFNFEAMINPLNALTAPNFNDPLKRVDMWSAAMDDLGKFGGSVHPLWTAVMALNLMAKGEEDAAARWGGTGILPQARMIKAATSLAGIGPPGGVQLDPLVWLFSGGIDPYERKRIGRASYAMLEENPELAAEGYDQAWQQDGELWDMAHERAVNERAWGQIGSFFLGIGFKGRSQQDMKVDIYDQQKRTLMARKADLTPDEWRQAWSDLNEAFPFGDFITLTRKGGVERDVAYAYSVLKRIPPGSSYDVAKLAGISDDLISQFYDTKGDLESWKESDRLRFMAGIVDLGAMLEIPQEATGAEWNEVKNRLSAARTEIEKLYGEDIWDKVDIYYALDDGTAKGQQAQDDFIEQFPEVDAAQSMYTYAKANDPLIAAYYGGYEVIDKYFRGLMYDTAEKELGADLWDLQREYWTLPTAQRKIFLRQHPQLKKYWTFKGEETDKINRQVVKFASLLPEKKGVQFREDIEGAGITAADIIKGMQADPILQLTPQDWQDEIGQYAFDYIYQNLFGGQELPYAADDLIESEAEDLGLSKNQLIQLVGMSIMNQNQELVLQ